MKANKMKSTPVSILHVPSVMKSEPFSTPNGIILKDEEGGNKEKYDKKEGIATIDR